MSDFETIFSGDADEIEPHLTPKEPGTSPARHSVQAPDGQWVDVPTGYVAVPGCEVDKNGILRRETGELAIWHHRCKKHGPCERYQVASDGSNNFVTLEEIVMIEGVPWCPDCVQKQFDDEMDKVNTVILHEMFGVPGATGPDGEGIVGRENNQ